MVIEPKKLRQEIETGNVNLNNLRIAYNAHIILDKHIEEDKKENSHIGTTNKGIGPCYKDKIGRIGLRFCDWLNSEHSDLTAFFKSCVVDVSEELNEKLNSGMKLMCEGAQGTFLDIDHGTYPFVTSSNCLAQAALVSLGLSPHRVNRIYGVTKAYTTRVGNGPFETEIKEKYIADKLIELGKEYGSTTGRKRRVGWLDLNLLKKAIRLNGVTDLVITKIDVLKQLGEELDIELPVFDTETMVHSFKTQQLMNSIEGFHLYIEEQTDTDVSIISFGPNKNDIKYF
jgi:adenylosuccinate synthase